MKRSYSGFEITRPLSTSSMSHHEKKREQTLVKRAGLVGLQEAGRGGEKLTYTAREVDLKADRSAHNYQRLAGGWEGMQKISQQKSL